MSARFYWGLTGHKTCASDRLKGSTVALLHLNVSLAGMLNWLIAAVLYLSITRHVCHRTGSVTAEVYQ